MQKFIMPSYNLTKIKSAVVNGPGYCILKKVFSINDIKIARSRVEYLTEKNDGPRNKDIPASQNMYPGLIWRLLGKGEIFEKIATHPALLEIAREILGPKSQISCYVSNTVQPGMPGQTPHIDYPYYDGYFPSTDQNSQRPLLSVTLMTMLSEFNKQVGATGLIPGSQRSPSYPADQEEFFHNCIQIEGEPGDVAIFAGCIQHCSMPNKSQNTKKMGIIQSMVPAYVTPYQDFRIPEHVLADFTPEMRDLLASSRPYPMPL